VLLGRWFKSKREFNFTEKHVQVTVLRKSYIQEFDTSRMQEILVINAQLALISRFKATSHLNK
jgi:hypothetical protein